MTFRIEQIDFFRVPMQTRFPFRYGIASMTQLPHMIVRARAIHDDQPVVGCAADGLPPKWFTKNPSTQFEQDDLPEMLKVIRHAADLAIDIPTQKSFFAWWHQLYHQQMAWAKQQRIPPLLAGLGASLIERAGIDAFCRSHGHSFHSLLLENAFEIDLATLDPSLKDLSLTTFLPKQPLKKVQARHTVGLGDPIDDQDVEPDGRPADGLPFTLVENIHRYGLECFKIKVQGDLTRDRARLQRLRLILESQAGPQHRFTLDGNEQFRDIDSFRQYWTELTAIP